MFLKILSVTSTLSSGEGLISGRNMETSDPIIDLFQKSWFQLLETRSSHFALRSLPTLSTSRIRIWRLSWCPCYSMARGPYTIEQREYLAMLWRARSSPMTTFCMLWWSFILVSVPEAPGVIDAYVSSEVESTGAHTQFYDKFNIRYEIFQVIKCIWSNDVYQQHLTKESQWVPRVVELRP